MTVLCVTDGGGAEVGAARADTVRRREAELRHALDQLGILRPPVLLGLADGTIREQRDVVAARLRTTLPGLAKDTLVVAPWVGDGHRDHRVLGEVCVEFAADEQLTLWQYPVWMWHWGSPDHPDVPWPLLVSVALDREQREVVARALEAFASQRSGSPPMLHARFLEHFDRNREYFVADVGGAA
ncbi:hypothetical protein GCM10025867_22910 [Frondihabitans sucicola]|uniref:PIG-L family deacetylase n=1 Tax=Frondihabitans sucicola TaxID=1268041 RepID=A0ABN6XYH1_9MICO|nr:PIG-L family deacetylase [Frondihabitans sucicola]BDZ50050.1 hypothetical protein GCM10025867_22910 [Frondihabitans sucicola]